jgi:hypothetical protein
MASLSDEPDNLQDMLGFGDSRGDTSRGDITMYSCPSPSNLSATSPSPCYGAYSVPQPLSAPRRSHRPSPRRSSPQVSTPTEQTVNRNAPGDENSPDYALAFTPGKTKLNTQSLLALQVSSVISRYCLKNCNNVNNSSLEKIWETR